jgi:hypothetical protein
VHAHLKLQEMKDSIDEQEGDCQAGPNVCLLNMIFKKVFWVFNITDPE